MTETKPHRETIGGGPAPETLGKLPAHAAGLAPRRRAVVSPEGSLTFQALHERCMDVARGLVAAGLRPGDRVAVLLPNGLAYLQAFYAIPMAGAVCVPMNTFLAPAEAVSVLEDSGAVALVTTRRSLASLSPKLGSGDLLRILILADGEEGTEVPAPEGIRTIPWKEMQGQRGSLPPSPDPGGLAVLTYTSGTTGRIKGVMLSHRNLIANGLACLEAVRIRKGDRLLLFLPMFHSLTQMVCMIVPPLSALTVILLPGVDRKAIADAMRRHRPTIFVAVPAIYSAMADHPPGRFTGFLNPVRLYLCGASPLPADVQERFEKGWRRPLCEGYGLSEASPVVSLNRADGARRPGSVGRPLPGVRIRILGDNGEERPPGEVGEIAVSGPNVMSGYHLRPEETAAALRDGWLLTGDLGRLDEAGYLYVVGRRKEMLIFRGMNIYPREVEEVLGAHPEVGEAAVVGVEDPDKGEVPYAAVTLKPGSSVDGRALRVFCREKLARYKIPRSILVVEALPKGPTGKILKNRVLDLVAASREEMEPSPPREAKSPDS